MKREASSSSFSPPFLSGVPALKGGHTFLKGKIATPAFGGLAMTRKGGLPRPTVKRSGSHLWV